MPGHSDQDKLKFYAEALVVDVLRTLKNYGEMGRNGMVEVDPSAQNHIFGFKLEPTSVHTTIAFEAKNIRTNYLNQKQFDDLLLKGISLPKGTKVSFGSEVYNEHLSLPTLTIEKKHYFKLYIRLSIRFDRMDQPFRNADGKEINARFMSFLLDCYWTLPEITSKNENRTEYEKWIKDVLALLNKRFYDKEFSYVP